MSEFIYPRASHKDRQSLVRTKLPDKVYAELAEYAEKKEMSVYAAARLLITNALRVELSAHCKRAPIFGGIPKNGTDAKQ